MTPPRAVSIFWGWPARIRKPALFEFSIGLAIFSVSSCLGITYVATFGEGAEFYQREYGPAVMVATQWHQIPLGDEFSRLCGMPFAGYMGFLTPGDLLEHIQAMSKPKDRRALTDRAAVLVDGKGMASVYQAVFGVDGNV